MITVDPCTVRDEGETTKLVTWEGWRSIIEFVMAYEALPRLAREWAELWHPCETEALALGLAAIAAASLALGRDVEILYGRRRLYPTLWIACVGETGRSRKEAIAAATEQLLRRVGSKVVIRRDVSSGEALVETLARDPHTMVLLRELGLLTDRARSRETRLLATKLLEAYDMPEQLDLCRTSKREDDDGLTVAESPTVGLVATGTPGDLVPLEELARRGLVSRMLLLPLAHQPRVPLPGGPATGDQDRVAQSFGDRLAESRTRGSIAMSAATIRYWSDPHDGIYARLRGSLDDQDEIQRACVERLEVHVLRLAAMTAILEGREEIEPDDCDRGEAVVMTAVERLLALIAVVRKDADAGMRDRAIRRISSALIRKSPQSRRDLERRVCDKSVSSKAFTDALGVLLADGRMGVEPDGKFVGQLSAADLRD